MSEYGEYIVRLSKTWATKPGEKLTEIVRCRDCKFSMFDKECSRVDQWEDETWFAIEPDGFCAWGERESE